MTDAAVSRVLMTGDTVGGVWTYALELAQALNAHGAEVILATMGALPTPEQSAEAERIPNLRLEASDYKLEWMDDPWDDVAESSEWLLDLDRQHKPDIVHLNSYGHGALPWRAPVVLTAHSCVLSWWAAVKHEPLPASWQRYRSEVEYSLKAADLITAPSHAMLDTLVENYGRDLPACRVVYNGRTASRFRQTNTEPIIFAAGRLWDQAKNMTALAEIAPRLTWPVYIAGERQHPNGTAAQFDGCHVLGRLTTDELAHWYGRASIYALPARYEPFGLSALEAALSGCALVLGDIESLREVWHDAAVFAPPEDADALEAALRALIDDPPRREEMAHRAAARAREYTSDRMANQYMDAYRWIAGRRGLVCVS